MNDQAPATFDALIQGKIDGDQAFQDSLAALSDEDKAVAIETKRTEVREAEFVTLRKADELAKNYKTRAEKAEGELKQFKPEPKPTDPPQPAAPTLSTADLYALMGAQVPQEDVAAVQEAALVLKLSISDALKHTVVINLLKTNAEFRASELAKNTRGGRPAATTPTDEQVLKDASEGKLPEPGTPEAEALFRARHSKK